MLQYALGDVVVLPDLPGGSKIFLEVGKIILETGKERKL
jgi:hypothetical protein